MTQSYNNYLYFRRYDFLRSWSETLEVALQPCQEIESISNLSGIYSECEGSLVEFAFFHVNTHQNQSKQASSKQASRAQQTINHDHSRHCLWQRGWHYQQYTRTVNLIFNLLWEVFACQSSTEQA